ncbi:MAG: hypothetical protein UX91_C0006G0192 [Candidatus Amesbacteria bacterium GW2011_GWB1_47_19]|nr:MAG: hypothetical protein UW51_C0002G0193 [Candidatus Amesbacteria bacterium GW2011_GWA1_44_24]KKU31216.1 MAG: hypothetical protein UX46_C0006G0008 [Candidatus Amesbacteria bacterium GW2011_GWC1_46_24]KKU67130.1 MAG: hypothetical protein UX91_C0006G0192 [Candidatus Amesbacteria bacterium GW2011_GWB1_47_19]OGD05486.1 MAG: hypothetical protein A2379_00820 [Candidatus Amesbacteria bacterium RIFOXYB1_FULL_47_13]HBC73000.1 hypothetical protein [Candidatus Amesbacteria bacterium]
MNGKKGGEIMKKIFLLLAVFLVWGMIPGKIKAEEKPYNFFSGTGSEWCELTHPYAETEDPCESWWMYYNLSKNDKVVVRWTDQIEKYLQKQVVREPDDPEPTFYGAWLDLEGNGKVPGGSGNIVHREIRYVCVMNSVECDTFPGYVVNGFQIIHWTVMGPDGLTWFAHQVQSGFFEKFGPD